MTLIKFQTLTSLNSTHSGGLSVKKRVNINKTVTHLAFTIPPVLLYSVFFVFSVLYGLFYSFTDWNGYSRVFEFIGFQNYARLFSDRIFIKALTFTLQYTSILVLFVTILALCLSYILCANIKCKTFFRALFFFPAALSLVTIGLIFNEIYYRVIPEIGKILEIEFLSKNILSSSSTAIWGILIVHVWKGVAIPTVLLIAGMQNIDIELYEASEIDGATKWQQFKSITFPLIIPILSVCIILITKEGLTVFDYIITMTEGGPAGSTQSISFLIYENAFSNQRYSYAIAQSVVIFILVCTVSYFQFRTTRKEK